MQHTDKDPSVGEKVKLHWTGSYHLPSWLDGENATVVSFSRSLILVRPEYMTLCYRVKHEHIIRNSSNKISLQGHQKKHV